MAKRKPRPTAMWRYETHGQKRGDTTHQELGPVKPASVARVRDFVAGYAPEATLRVFQAAVVWTELDPVTLEPLEGSVNAPGASDDVTAKVAEFTALVRAANRAAPVTAERNAHGALYVYVEATSEDEANRMRASWAGRTWPFTVTIGYPR